MTNTLLVVFRRDSSRDREQENVQFEGYQILWPDGRPVSIGTEALCRNGQRFLGLGRSLAGCTEKLIELLCIPRCGLEDEWVRVPGHRVRRLFIERIGHEGRLHFLNGMPTSVVFDNRYDDQRVLDWIGLSTLGEGQRQWMDLAARPPVATVV